MDERDVRADCLDGLREVGDDLVVGAQRGRRRDHDAGSAGIHRAARQRAHRREAWR